jgi:hypothetical protein
MAENSRKHERATLGSERKRRRPMERNGLFFDPLQGEELSPVGEIGAETETGSDGGALGHEPTEDDADQGPHVGTRHPRQDPAELQEQRRRELDRVQEDLRRMAEGFPVAVAPSRRDRAGGRAR